MEEKNVKQNVLYSLVQGFYWMLYCSVIAYASVYLINQGFDNTKIGFILAIGFLCSMVLQQAIGTLADNMKRLSLPNLIFFCTLILAVIEELLLRLKGSMLATEILFAGAAVLVMLLQPLVNSLNFYMERRSGRMNFGVARAFGSLFCAILSTVLGVLTEKISPMILPVTTIVVCGLMMLVLTIINSSCPKNKYVAETVGEVKTKAAVSEGFFKKYAIFFVFLFGVLFFYFSHTLINNFYFQIISNSNGTSKDMGIILAFAAIMELPAMIFFEKINKKFDVYFLINFSSVFFLIKIICTTFSTNVLMHYFSMALQGLAFAVFIPAGVVLVNSIMEEKDAVKGQAFVTMVFTGSSLLASLLGGKMIDSMGVKMTLMVGCGVTVVGVIISIFSVIAMKKKFGNR